MRFLTNLLHAYKVTNLSYTYKNSLNYTVITVNGDYKTEKRGFASKASGGELNGYEGFQEAFAILSLLRDNSRQVELLTEHLEELKKKTDQKDEEIRNGIGQQNQCNSLAVNSTKELKEVDKEMKNLMRSLFNPNALIHSVVSKQATLSLPFDSTTIPLHLNTLIDSTVESDFSKKNTEIQIQNLKVPELNEYLTSLAVNLCSVALQNGFASQGCQKYYCTNNTHDTSSISKMALSATGNDKFKKVGPSSEEIVKDLLKKHDDFRNGVNKTLTMSGNSGKTNEPGTKGVTNSFGLLDPQLYKKSLKEAETKRKALAKASASCKEKLSLRACQSKKSTVVKCERKIESVKHFESVTEPSSPFKCGSKPAESKKSENLESKFFSDQKDNSGPSGLISKSCDSKKSEQKDPCEALPKITSKQDQRCKPKSQKLESKSKCDSELKSNCGSVKSSESGSNPQKYEPISKHGTGEKSAKKNIQTKTSLMSKINSENSDKFTETSKLEISSKCSSKCKSKQEDPSKISPVIKSKLCGSSSGTEDPCKVPPITFKNMPTKSAEASKCLPPPSKAKCGARKEEKPSSSCESPSVSKCATPPKPKCKASKEDKPPSCVSKLKNSSSASKCSPKVEQLQPTVSKCCSKCNSGNSCVKLQKEPTDDAASDKACKRVGMTAKKSCESEPKNPCKSSCDSVVKPKPKCGRPPRGDTRPRCKKDSKCGSKKPSPCASKHHQSESKCGTELKPKPSKCGSKACAPSPKTSKTEINPRPTCSSKSKTLPSSEPTKRKLHSLSNFSAANLIFSRNYSDDCPEKPRGGYKLESERSDEYRRETCENFSWKDTKSRKKRTKKPKNCYPEETLEFCPDTACYKVYAETSGKADKKRSKRKPKANKMETDEALCTKRTTGNSLHHQKRHFSSNARENEEALIQKPHSVCTRKITLPEITDHEALICVDSVALSDTDIYMFETGGRHTPELTLGNEASGIVNKVGRSICNLHPGDHVVLESGIPCFKCDLCKVGRYNLCSNISFRGFLKNQSIHPASFCHKICPSISLEHAALIPQLALGCNACYQACIKPNSNVAIIGSCAKTVCAAVCAISMGAENICVVCGMPETQILIEQFVTQKVDCFGSTTSEKGIVRKVLATLGTFPDIVINCSASTKTMNAAIIALKPAGVCIVAGFLSECVAYNIMDALMKEIRIVPSFRSKNMFPKAIHLLESGRAPLDCLIANCELCKWNELECAFKLALSEGNNGPRKAIIRCQLSE